MFLYFYGYQILFFTQQQTKRNHFLMIIYLSILAAMCFSLTSCNSGGVGVSAAPISPDGSAIGELVLPQIAPLQITGTTLTRRVFLPIRNTTNTTISLNAYTLSTAEGEESAISSCSEISAGSTCIVEVMVPNTFKYNGTGNFILTIYGIDTKGHQYKSNTIINYKKIDNVSPLNMESEINYALNNNGNDYLVIPAILNSNINNPLVTLNNSNHNVQIFCDKTDYQYCSIVVDMHSSDTSTKTTLALNDGNSQTLTSEISAYTPHIAGNLVATGLPAIISPSNGATKLTITLVNNGNAPLTLSSESAATPIAIESNNCGTNKLESTATCSFVLSAVSQINGAGNVNIKYVTMNKIQTLTFSVSYYPSYISIGASVSAAASLQGIIKSTIIPTVATIVNNSNVPLTYLGIGSLNAQSASFSESSGYSAANKCIKSGTIAAGASCTLQFNYAPTVGGESGNLVIAPIFSYTGVSGESLTYVGASMTIPFSSSSNYYFYFGGSSRTQQESSAYSCNFNPTTGALSNCGVQVPVGPAQTKPQGFVTYGSNRIFVSNTTVHYTSNAITDAISSCTVNNSTGNLSCTLLSTGSVAMSWPVGMAVNNGYLYIVNRSTTDSAQLVKCNYSSINGTLTNCIGYPGTVGGMSLSGPYGIAIYNNVAYITNRNQNIYSCAISNTDGSLSNCSILNIVVTNGYSPGTPITTAHALVISNGILYVSTFSDATITVCQIGQWSSCYRFQSLSLLGTGGILGLSIYGNYLFASSQSSSTPYPVRFTLQSNGTFESSTAVVQTVLSSYAGITGMLGIGTN